MHRLTVLTAVKADTMFRAIPVVVLSTSSAAAHVRRAYDLHAHGDVASRSTWTPSSAAVGRSRSVHPEQLYPVMAVACDPRRPSRHRPGRPDQRPRRRGR